MTREQVAIEDWESRRSRFNHDWLKNRHLNRLDGFLALLESPAAAPPDLLAGFLQHDLLEWEAKAGQARALLAQFEDEMSPRACFSQPPLCLLPAARREWLAHELHHLWQRRFPVSDWVGAAQEALRGAEQAYHELESLLGSDAGERVKRAPTLRAEFAAFAAACRRLGDCVARLPHEILIV